MTYKQIEASREARLWIGQIIVPTVIGVGMILSNPQARQAMVTKAQNVKKSFKNKFRKG